MGKVKVNTDSYYHFVYNQQYRLDNRDYYREYCKNYNKNNRSSINRNTLKYQKLKNLNNKKGPMIEFKEAFVRIEWS